MANKTRGEYDLHIGKQTRTLRFRFNELAELQSLGVQAMLQDGRVLLGIREIVRIGLKHSDPRLTPDKVGKWFDEIDDEEPGKSHDLIMQIATFYGDALQGGGHAYEEDGEGKPQGA